MQLPSNETVTVIFKHHRKALRLEQVDHVDVSFIGQGTGHLNLRVTVNHAQHFNLRIGLRKRKKAERTLQSEFHALRLLPPGIGPRGIVIDFGRTLLAQPYSILEYLPGETKTAWSDNDLETHACTLAQLHQRKFDQHGRFGRLTDARFDILHRFEVNLHYWQTHRPDLFDLASVQRVLPTIRHFVTGHHKVFADLHAFTIVHGDLHPLHILFHDNRLHYIDWQWARVGDPAYDIATTGWDIATEPGIKLSGQRLDTFLDTYSMHEVDATLRQRRDVWMVYDMFFSYLYFRGRLSADSTGKQSGIAHQIEAYLTERFS